MYSHSLLSRTAHWKQRRASVNASNVEHKARLVSLQSPLSGLRLHVMPCQTRLRIASAAFRYALCASLCLPLPSRSPLRLFNRAQIFVHRWINSAHMGSQLVLLPNRRSANETTRSIILTEQPHREQAISRHWSHNRGIRRRRQEMLVYAQTLWSSEARNYRLASWRWRLLAPQHHPLRLERNSAVRRRRSGNV